MTFCINLTSPKGKLVLRSGLAAGPEWAIGDSLSFLRCYVAYHGSGDAGHRCHELTQWQPLGFPRPSSGMILQLRPVWYLTVDQRRLFLFDRTSKPPGIVIRA